MESLHAEVSARVSAEVRPLMVAPPAKGSLEARARDFARARAAGEIAALREQRANNKQTNQTTEEKDLEGAELG